jgi:hypothetical protein
MILLATPINIDSMEKGVNSTSNDYNATLEGNSEVVFPLDLGEQGIPSQRRIGRDENEMLPESFTPGDKVCSPCRRHDSTSSQYL